MSTQYTTEPPPTATVLLHTTAGPLTLSLFATQTPLTTLNFLQHCLDGTYTNTIFHRVASGFVIQTGDPTGTGEGGTNIYEDGDKNQERYGETWGRLLRLPEERYNERIVLGDEVHSRLKFNRRGLVGMARMGDGKGDAQGQYGSQWFITLGDCRAELDGKCTMFGRIEGDGIYNVMKIANAEVIEGTERPVYPEKVLSVEVLEMPEGEAWKSVKKREKIAQRTVADQKETGKKTKTTGKKKGGKTLLSFAGDGGDEDGADVVVRPKKAKFNTALIDSPAESTTTTTTKTITQQISKKRKSPEPIPPQKSPEPTPKRRKPSFHESTTQLPIRDPESPSRSPTPDVPEPKRRSSNHKSASALEAEIAALKATMKRDTAPAAEPKKKLSALEALIPASSTRGRKRPRPGENTAADDNSSLKLLNAFKARLEGATQSQSHSTTTSTTANPTVPTPSSNGTAHPPNPTIPEDTTEEASLCDLHFIANCQSCSDWIDTNPDPSTNDPANPTDPEDTDPSSFLTHSLTFEKDRLGKDLTWKRKNEEELVVIDPRERERELGIKSGKKERERGKGKAREWDGDLGVGGVAGKGKGRDRDREKGGERRR